MRTCNADHSNSIRHNQGPTHPRHSSSYNDGDKVVIEAIDDGPDNQPSAAKEKKISMSLNFT